MPFVRELSDELISKLKEEKLYKEYLLPDINNCEVFPAIRNNEIHFYHKGGRLFKYTNEGFISNIKFAYVCPDCNYKAGDIKESDLPHIKPIEKFTEGYNQIKEYCAKYNKGSESEYVSRLFKNYSYINPQPQEDIYLLDIEASLESTKEDKYQDRFDIVLLNKNTHSIKVVEAKLYSNPDLKKSKNAENPQVVTQIKDYQDNIADKNSEIIEAYKNYLCIVKKLFDINLPDFDKIESKVGLLYGGFDGDNKGSDRFDEIKNILHKDLPENKIYPLGNSGDGKNLQSLF